MSERPILFSAPMVRAIIGGDKTQTRRVLKPQPSFGQPWHGWIVDPEMMDIPTAMCPHGITGDRLWVREAIGIHCRPEDGLEGYCVYRADFPDGPLASFEPGWTPSIHMPRWACRLVLEVGAVRVQRLQDITEADAKAEGMERTPVGTATWSNRQSFAVLWDQLNGKREGCAWENNPWVWAIEFALYR